MTTECNLREFDFQAIGCRGVAARFDGGAIASDAGGLLLREVEVKTGILRRFVACFTDHCQPPICLSSAPPCMSTRQPRRRPRRSHSVVVVRNAD
jgi:hypothetical protein